MLRKILSSIARLLGVAIRRPAPQTADDAIAARFPGNALARQFFHRVYEQVAYDRRVAAKLVDVAGGKAGEAWELRCLAILLLEHVIWRLPPDSSDLQTLLSRFTQDPALGLHRRLRRLDYLHHAFEHPSASRGDFDSFLRLLSQESKLTLARYFLSPEEVLARMDAQMEITAGTKDVRYRRRILFDAEAEAAVGELTAWESAVIQQLLTRDRVYWVTEHTSSRLNSMVEYPIGSAVLVVKPPGSNIELEIKRAGLRGKRRLNVIFQKPNGSGIAPLSHRLHGGSFGWLGRREAEAASLLSFIYRQIHGRTAPICLTLGIVSVRTVPGPGGETHILDYLTSEKMFGDGFETMRSAIREGVERLPQDTGVAVHPYRGPAGLTLQFMAQALPQQAVLLNTTSFRLDRVALYLSRGGPAEYFEKGLKMPYTPDDSRCLADDVLSEILGVFRRPSESCQDYGGYVASAFAANRQRADQNFGECMRQVGHFWGTLLGLRGYTDGESFVVRNVGLRTVWEEGEWRIRVIFMDHDDLFILGKKKLYFWPHRALLGMYRDEMHVMGSTSKDNPLKGEVGLLKEIYRVNEATYSAGMNDLRGAMRAAYQKTLAALESDPKLKGLFFDPFTVELRDWDAVVRMHFNSANNWRTRAADFLRAKSYDQARVEEYLRTVEEFSDFLHRTSFLY